MLNASSNPLSLFAVDHAQSAQTRLAVPQLSRSNSNVLRHPQGWCQQGYISCSEIPELVARGMPQKMYKGVPQKSMNS